MADMLDQIEGYLPKGIGITFILGAVLAIFVPTMVDIVASLLGILIVSLFALRARDSSARSEMKELFSYLGAIALLAIGFGAFGVPGIMEAVQQIAYLGASASIAQIAVIATAIGLIIEGLGARFNG